MIFVLLLFASTGISCIMHLRLLQYAFQITLDRWNLFIVLQIKRRKRFPEWDQLITNYSFSILQLAMNRTRFTHNGQVVRLFERSLMICKDLQENWCISLCAALSQNRKVPSTEIKYSFNRQALTWCSASKWIWPWAWTATIKFGPKLISRFYS